ncbi:MAG TPA: hypothetical protein VGK29_10760 [Paludibaculum sp.]
MKRRRLRRHAIRALAAVPNGAVQSSRLERTGVGLLSARPSRILSATGSA